MPQLDPARDKGNTQEDQDDGGKDHKNDHHMTGKDHDEDCDKEREEPDSDDLPISFRDVRSSP